MELLSWSDVSETCSLLKVETWGKVELKQNDLDGFKPARLVARTLHVRCG